MFKEKLETDRSIFGEKVRPEQKSSIVNIIRHEMRNHSAMVQNRLKGKLEKQSERHDRALRY